MLANTTDHLQPMDISVNKLAKDFLKRQFDQWYSEQVVAQLEREDASELQPINPWLASLDGAKWLVDMATYMYISDKSKIIINGFIRSGIMEALDGQDIDDLVEPDDEPEHDSGENFDSESGEDSNESEEECQRQSMT